MKKTATREARLLEELELRERLTIAEIEAMFDVSESTARRMCALLDQRGKAIRVIGGLQALMTAQPAGQEYSYEIQSTRNIEAKRRIGQYAGSLVADGDIVFVTGGTTMQQFVMALAQRLKAGALKRVAVMTNALDHANLLAESPEVRIILTGGEYQPGRRDLIGAVCERTIGEVRFNKCFSGVDGIDLRDGLMTLDSETAAVDRLASERSDEVFVLADHSKFQKQSYISYERLMAKHTVITDDGIEPEILAQSRGGPWRIVTVGGGPASPADGREHLAG